MPTSILTAFCGNYWTHDSLYPTRRLHAVKRVSNGTNNFIVNTGPLSCSQFHTDVSQRTHFVAKVRVLFDARQIRTSQCHEAEWFMKLHIMSITYIHAYHEWYMINGYASLIFLHIICIYMYTFFEHTFDVCICAHMYSYMWYLYIYISSM